MSSSATGSTRADAGDGVVDAPAELERAVERLDQGIVVTYELRAEGEEPVDIDLSQSLPSELTVADVGFRTDAAPADWSVDGDTVSGSGTVPRTGSVEYVLGLKLPEGPDELPDFPAARVTECEAADATATEPASSENPGADPVADPTDIDLDEADTGTGAPDDGSGDAGTASTDDPALVGNTDGALADSVRAVIGEDGAGADDAEAAATDTSAGTGTVTDAGDGEAAATDAGEHAAGGAPATDGGPEATGTTAGPESTPAPRQEPATGDELEAAVAAVEPDLEAAEASGTGESGREEAPELDLSLPEMDTDETDPDGEDGADTGTTASSTGATEPDTGAPAPDIPGLADRLAAADDADRRAIRSALGIGEEGDPAGTVTVRLQQLESRLSAFEAYEDALASFIDETGTVEEIEATASEAAEAADELRTEVGDLREEVVVVREELEAASEERAALREDLTALREDVDEAAGLRQQLLGALQTAGGAAGGGAAADGSADGPSTEERSADATE